MHIYIPILEYNMVQFKQCFDSCNSLKVFQPLAAKGPKFFLVFVGQTKISAFR